MAAAVLHNKALIHFQRGNLGRAELLLRDVVGRDEILYGREAPRLVQPLSELSETLLRLDRPAEAEPVLRRAVRLSEQAGDATARARALSMLAAAEAAQGFQHARSTARRSLEAWKATGHEVPLAHLRDLEAIIAGTRLPPAASSRRRR